MNLLSQNETHAVRLAREARNPCARPLAGGAARRLGGYVFEIGAPSDGLTYVADREPLGSVR